MRHRDDFLKITREQIMAAVDYDPVSGIFTWKWREGIISQVNACHAGKPAGKVGTDGYMKITISRRGYMAHRLAFVIMTGRWPSDDIDHENLNKSDNRWENLREATISQNHGNIPGRSKKGLPKGVWKSDNKFTAAIKQNGKNVYLGNYFTPEEAHEAYMVAARKYYGDAFARA